MSAIPAIRRLKQEDQEFHAGLGLHSLKKTNKQTNKKRKTRRAVIWKRTCNLHLKCPDLGIVPGSEYR
jgi:hypothetical protein